MAIKLAGYTGPCLTASIATQAETAQKILALNHNVLLREDEGWRLFSDALSCPGENREGIERDWNDFDVMEISETGFCRPLYRTASNDNALVVTTQCNSNCIMCPSPEASRKGGAVSPIEKISEIIDYIPSDAPHLTITGGEPTLLRSHFFTLMDRLNERLPSTNLLYLTNARAFGHKVYAQRFNDAATKLSRIAIPLHASNAYLHDYITQATGSFAQTTAACHYLAESRAEIEIRVVVSLLNIGDMNDLVEFLIRRIPRITCVNYIALEMSGSAALNRDAVWLDYRRAFQGIKDPLLRLVAAGIDVNLYNFPLCSLEKGYWDIARESISDYKVCYAPPCGDCEVRAICGGQFVSTLNGGFFQVRPIKKTCC
jgi:His-Xaa-Ser system radical SAM maturase HxsC